RQDGGCLRLVLVLDRGLHVVDDGREVAELLDQLRVVGLQVVGRVERLEVVRGRIDRLLQIVEAGELLGRGGAALHLRRRGLRRVLEVVRGRRRAGLVVGETAAPAAAAAGRGGGGRVR